MLALALVLILDRRMTRSLGTTVPNFHLIDLVSQREAVRHHLKDWPVDDIVEWIAARGELSKSAILGRPTYFFESAVGRQAVFFFDGNEIVFLADHTTFK